MASSAERVRLSDALALAAQPRGRECARLRGQPTGQRQGERRPNEAPGPLCQRRRDPVPARPRRPGSGQSLVPDGARSWDNGRAMMRRRRAAFDPVPASPIVVPGSGGELGHGDGDARASGGGRPQGGGAAAARGGGACRHVLLVPDPDDEYFFGIAKGASSENFRDRKDRYRCA